MEDHALALLKQEHLAGKSGAHELLQYLAPRTVASADEFSPRQAWLQQPDCLNCHTDFAVGSSIDAFNTWTSGENTLFRNRHDLMGVMMCQACHGSTHALFPAHNKYGSQRDIIQPLQYQGNDRPIGHDCTGCRFSGAI